MLRKLSLLLFITHICTVHADQLSEAIRSSNLQQVISLLSGHSITEKQLIKYFDLAEQIIKARHEEARLAQIGKVYETTKATKYSECVFLTSLASSVFVTPILFTMADYYHFNEHHTKSAFCAITGAANLVGCFASLIVALTYITKAKQEYCNKCFALFNDAIRIKELLYDYELSLSDIKE